MVTGIAPKAEQSEVKGVGTSPAPETPVAGAAKHTETTYTQAELDERLGRAGGRIKAQLELVTRERDEYRQKHESASRTHEELNSQITAAQQKIDTLNDALESLDSEDAAKVKQLIRSWEKRLGDLTEREKTLVPREERVNTFERSELIYLVADEYGLDDAEAKDKFKGAADRLQLKDRDRLIALAESMGLDLRPEPEDAEKEKKPKAPIPFTGKPSGSGPESLESLLKKDTRFMSVSQLTDLKEKVRAAHKAH